MHRMQQVPPEFWGASVGGNTGAHNAGLRPNKSRIPCLALVACLSCTERCPNIFRMADNCRRRDPPPPPTLYPLRPPPPPWTQILSWERMKFTQGKIYLGPFGFVALPSPSCNTCWESLGCCTTVENSATPPPPPRDQVTADVVLFSP